MQQRGLQPWTAAEFKNRDKEMKQYVIDQLRETDYDRIIGFLRNNADPSEFGDVFWIDIPEEIYSNTQRGHKDCRPFCFAVNLTFNRCDFELLVRSRRVLRCNCIGYADKTQRDYIMDYADRMLEELNIRI